MNEEVRKKGEQWASHSYIAHGHIPVSPTDPKDYYEFIKTAIYRNEKLTQKDFKDILLTNKFFNQWDESKQDEVIIYSYNRYKDIVDFLDYWSGITFGPNEKEKIKFEPEKTALFALVKVSIDDETKFEQNDFINMVPLRDLTGNLDAEQNENHINEIYERYENVLEFIKGFDLNLI